CLQISLQGLVPAGGTILHQASTLTAQDGIGGPANKVRGGQLFRAVGGGKRNDSFFPGARHQAPQRIVARLLGKETLPEKVVGGTARPAAGSAQGFRQRSHESSTPHGPLNQAF